MNLFDFFQSSSNSGKSKQSRLQFEDMEVLVIRRPRRRTMTIRMRPHEPIQVTTAMRVPDHEVLRFLQLKKVWIKKNLNDFSALPAPVERIGAVGEKWLYLGELKVLEDRMTVLAKPFVVWDEKGLGFYWPQKDWLLRNQKRNLALKLIEESLREQAQKLMQQRVQIYSERMQLYPQKIRLMQARTRWGSCSSRGQINLNWRLVSAPIEVIDAIVVHELAHLKHMNHSKEFWSLVELHAPHHEQADAWLRQHQSLFSL